MSYQSSLRGLVQKPPIRGSFPLDHDGKEGLPYERKFKRIYVLGECKNLVEAYIKCIRDQELVKDGGSPMNCRDLTKQYLECRMKNQLMDQESFENLGLQESSLK